MVSVSGSFISHFRHVCISAGRAQVVHESADREADDREADGEDGPNDEEHYCTSLRERPPASNWDLVNRSLQTMTMEGSQAAYNTAGAGEGHGHRRCRGPGAKRGCNREEGSELNHDNDKNLLPTFLLSFLPKHRTFEWICCFCF